MRLTGSTMVRLALALVLAAVATASFAQPPAAELPAAGLDGAATIVSSSPCAPDDLLLPAAEERITFTPQFCGDPCSTAGDESLCTGYACSGLARRGSCTCLPGLFRLVWTCSWAC